MNEATTDPRAQAIYTLQTFPRTEQMTALTWAFIYYVDTIAGHEYKLAAEERQRRESAMSPKDEA